MTKGQEVTADLIEKYISIGQSFEWKCVVQAVNQSGAKVRNWLTIRSVLQYYLNNDMIYRDNSDLTKELYHISL
jgi:hypothetical protein